jgi:elongation factor Ts
MSYTAKDVSSLRQSTGAGMMDCKKALEESGGEIEAAKQWLREKGLAASAKRDDRDNAQGVVSIIIDGARASIVKLKCETDFVASSDSFKAEADALAAAVLEKGEAGLADRTTQIDDLKILLKEKIEVGETIRFEAAAGSIIESYAHIQGGRGVNGVIVEMSGASAELAHDIAVHIAFARPKYLTQDEVPADVVAKEREQAVAKIVDGRIGGFFKDVCLLEQPYAKDDKVSIKQLIGDAKIIRFAQVEIG